LLLAVERRRIAYPKAQDYADFQRGLQQRFAIGEMVFDDQFARQKSSNHRGVSPAVLGRTFPRCRETRFFD
jgi:hypothetical protein